MIEFVGNGVLIITVCILGWVMASDSQKHKGRTR